MMDRLLQDFSAELQAHQGAPCLSLYQPTHRAMAGRQQDALRFRNLVDELEASLQRDYAKRDVGPLIKPFRALADDAGFWRGTMRDGLAVLGSAELFRVYHLQRPVPELAVAAGSFHVKPLIRILQSADRYHVLGVDRERIRLFEGNRDQLDELELPAGFPRTSQDVLGERENQRYVGAWAARAGQAGVLHGAGSDSDIVDTAMERFFRAVDQAVLEQYSRPSGRPLLLAGLPENLGRFRAFSRNPFVLEASIGVHPDTLAPEALREQAWRAIEPTYLARLQGLVESYQAGYAHELGDSDVAKVARSAVAGRVATLLVDAERRVPGRLDLASGAIEPDALRRPDVDDLLDDIAQQVLAGGGQVVMVPSARMPTDTGLAAIYRY
ncbi:MAG TPA: hypothetical protein PK606_11905 [Ottowia sp.]|uniref:baeRF3 domain-containing protein n=2 Tax=Ottowia sp. TaxID=1898956 RepID=UPI002BB0006C|nr:hypothetical protein [Ottowia sp.]HRQ03546.1 hypothetical protein [Ottowia sp.]